VLEFESWFCVGSCRTTCGFGGRLWQGLICSMNSSYGFCLRVVWKSY